MRTTTEQKSEVAAVAVQRMVRRLNSLEPNGSASEETYDSEETAYCNCGEQINIVRGSNRTSRRDKIRLRYPDDTQGWGVFRCRKCGEVADPKPKHPNGTR